MILPSKHISLSESLLGLAGVILAINLLYLIGAIDINTKGEIIKNEAT